MNEAADLAMRCECPAEAGSAACELRPRRRKGVPCPTCGQPGKVVDVGTLKALLAVPLTEILSVDYLFCGTADCPAVYFAAEGKSRFTEDRLRERVHQKHPEEEGVFVCYCFRHTPGSISAELSETGRTTVLAAVTGGIRAGKCACEIRNPQGSCCLGNVRAVVDRLANRALADG